MKILNIENIKRIVLFPIRRKWRVIPESNGTAERTSESYLDDPKVKALLEDTEKQIHP